ncbi:hypothetical protein [Glycomyces harbinensis]|uniref:Excreted virulence factor EspC, type VII ESX diderm n=1 Tax=Glycomyces harbinensis TaxID=58114 RepID=A0A1G6WPD6_9ACTN|nr:hypothetical protein [Glycomyces harbinensis]SDD67728.1 hypothetical protein SAMN05216270_106146 [Glycomyces harbinensis]
MTVFMKVEQVRGGGADLRTLAPGARRASERVRAPAESAASGNAGFLTGQAGVQWQAALGTVTEGVERRVEWQGAQVTGSADDLDGTDRSVGGDIESIGRDLPVRRPSQEDPHAQL